MTSCISVVVIYDLPQTIPLIGILLVVFGSTVTVLEKYIIPTGALRVKLCQVIMPGFPS